jgi:hypothetical protein
LDVLLLGTGWGGFSLGALKHMEFALRSGDGVDGSSLVATCARWGITHDVGLGVFTWNHLPLSIIRLKSLSVNLTDGAIWHQPAWSYDKIMEYHWTQAAKIKYPDRVNVSFNISNYNSYESSVGNNYLYFNTPLVHLWDQFQNSHRYKNHNVMISEYKKKGNYQQAKDSEVLLKSYNYSDCNEDMMQHKNHFRNYRSDRSTEMASFSQKCSKKYQPQ